MNRPVSIFLCVMLAVSVTMQLSAAPARAKTKKKVDPMEKYDAAITAFDNYNFSEAVQMLDEYRASVNKSDGKTSYPDEADLRRRSEIGAAMLDRVEQVVIIDSIVVSKHDFFNTYQLSHAAGTLLKSESIAPDFKAADETPVYVTEKGNTMIYSILAPEDSLLKLHTTSRLVDGSWEKPYNIASSMIDNANTAFPFLMPDGITLYFASDNDESLGGYDIFMSRREGKDYLKPQNIGMPYNSPSDDYMLAIDEVNGTGWWATDRNNIPDSLTIYVFAPAELRINYPADTPELTDKARITDIASSTRQEGKTYPSVIQRNHNTASHNDGAKSDFHFALPDGSVCTSISQLHSPDAVAAMHRYLAIIDETTQLKSDLNGLRQRYAAGDKNVSSEILTLENELLKQQRLIRDISNNIIKAEFPNR
ncbi:MAG: hypothetical protein K2M94_05870 [Paramuribaculum sp.]|nr:hypothetical protein [Paramuribaculum sp.]